ncbi:sulfurtransferase [Luteimonas viscosa]|uniref:Sulfurtransferase n=1 Tax=Luteimonas viscosa TaxID=1132694 RepID=A0A5D4XUD0_9GAMM|nr:rhodanese-like domain-containing protein [Luteimonas viscosa]TYT26400.1 sulfurtransferase [Luteimonas viscosa]
MTLSVEQLVAQARSRIRELDPGELSASPARDAVLIDVREPDEYAQGHLPGAVNLPRGVLEFQIHAHPAMGCTASESLALPDRPLVLYCRTGGRSALAAESLQQLGFSDVHSLAGGFEAWRNAGLPTTNA